MIDKEIEEKLKDKELFDQVMPVVIKMWCNEKSKSHVYDIMAMRLGHEGRALVLWKIIQSRIFSVTQPTRNVSIHYCQYLYARGLRFARRAMNALGISLET